MATLFRVRELSCRRYPRPVGKPAGSLGCGESGVTSSVRQIAQRHRGKDLLQPIGVGGGEQPERAPLARLQRRAP